METMKPEFDLHIQKSFSFTAFSKFKDSSLEFFSDDEDDENDRNDPNNPKNHDSSYIEISLDRTNPNGNKTIVKNASFENHLRISFSSSFPSIPEAQPQNPASSSPSPSSSPSSTSSPVRLSASSLRSSSTGTLRGPALGEESFNNRYEGSSRRRSDRQLPPFNPLIHTLLFSLETHPSPAPETVDRRVRRRDLDGGDRRDWKGFINHDRPLAVTSNADFSIHRKTALNTKTTTTGSTSIGNQNGIMNKLLMFKLRAAKVGKLLSSLFTKSRGQVNMCNPNNVENDISNMKGPKRQLNSVHDNYTLSAAADTRHSSNGGFYKPRAMEVNLGTVRGVLEAMNNMGNGKRNSRGNRRKTSSCPSSIKSSPIHQGFGGDPNKNDTFFGAENSIQAAIAHCKSSLGQSIDFQL